MALEPPNSFQELQVKTVNIMVPCGDTPEPLPDACERNPKPGKRDDFVPSHTHCSVASAEGRGGIGGPKEQVQTHPHPAHVAQFAFVSQRVLENLESEEETEAGERWVCSGAEMGMGER